jgi:prepilin-type N-terminal cleavage/methylation domain-containing protein
LEAGIWDFAIWSLEFSYTQVFFELWYDKYILERSEKDHFILKMTIKKERLEIAARRGRLGFTLIEILIVVAIIAILASIVIVGLGPAQQSGRDARRISDLQSIQNGLELYYQKCGYYPGGTVASGAQCTGFTAVSFGDMSTALINSGLGITNVPDDPTGGKHYQYASTDGTNYTLEATLENSNNTVFQNYNFQGPANGLTCTDPDYCVSL